MSRIARTVDRALWLLALGVLLVGLAGCNAGSHDAAGGTVSLDVQVIWPQAATQAVRVSAPILPETAPANVAKMNATVTVGAFSTSQSFTASAGTGSIANVPPGAGSLTLDALDASGTKLYTGTNTYTGTANQTATVTVSMAAAPGQTVPAWVLSGTWATKAPMPTSRTAVEAVAVGGLVYVMGGTLDFSTSFVAVEIYNPATDTWSTGPSMLSGNQQGGAVTTGGKIYVCSGSSIQILDLATSAWSVGTATPSPSAGYGASADIITGIVYVAGGGDCTSGTCVESKFLRAYDTVAKTWSKKADMPTARIQPAAVAYNGLLYVIGGALAAGGTSLAVAEVYDPATNAWKSLASMPTSRTALAAAVINKIIYVVGGNATSVIAYDPAANTWTNMTPMSKGRYAPAAAVVNGVMYVVGGGTTNATVTTNESFTP